MKIHIGAVGRMKRGPVCELFETYRKRLPWPIEVIEIDDRKTTGQPDGREREGKALLEAVPKGAWRIALDENGKSLSSKTFAARLTEWQDRGHSTLSFMIGGADGHAKPLLNEADFILSIGEMTWPHMLVRAMLAEQLYRAWSIGAGHPYHRE